MKKSFTELINKSVKELEKEIDTLKNDVLKMGMGSSSNPVKDTNSVPKKKRRLAVVMTALNQHKEVEGFKSTKKI